MDRNLRDFIRISLAIVMIFTIIIVGLVFFYQYSTLNIYNYILLFFTLLIILITLLVVFSVGATFLAYKTEKTNRVLIWFIRLGLRAVMPFIIYASGAFKGNRDALRQFYIDMNNILVQKTVEKKYIPEDVLVILPHCLQNSKCQYKVTGNISNCRRCGQCCIGEIADVMDETGVAAEIVTGGTAARNIVSEKKPGIILSVACERDLTSGISDIADIPVLGIINERPNGPCCNTNVDADLIRKSLDKIIIGTRRPPVG